MLTSAKDCAFRFSACVTLIATAATIVGAAGCSTDRRLLPGGGPEATSTSRYAPRFLLIKSQPPVAMEIAFLMTDGSVVAESYDVERRWYRYAPDGHGDYSDGTWTRIASLQRGYAPYAYASQVLADGRLVIVGGEYNDKARSKYPLQLTNRAAVYDPVANHWTRLGHPHGWGWIGDSPSSLLPDGRMLIGQKLTERDAALDPATLTWTPVSDAGKADENAEEGWTLLPDGTILTADVKDATNSEIYNPATGKWKSAGSTVVQLASIGGEQCLRYGPKKKDCYNGAGEIGPAILRPDGTVFYTGAGTGVSDYGTGNTAVYHTRGRLAGKWTVGPEFPSGLNASDTYAILEPSGNVLVFARGTLLEFDGTQFENVGQAAGPPILLPTGQVLMLGASVVLYTPPGSPQAAWAPHIKTCPSTIRPGKTYKIAGTQFNGLSQAMSFGDEFQNSTNYPLVRITNATSGRVYYARTHDHSTMGVATGSKLVWTYFDVPKAIDTGKSTLVVIANGIASNPITISVA
jgi:hypothetical protein